MENYFVKYTLRIDRILLEKIKFIASEEVRSANKEIEQYLKKRVAEYEKEHGEIKVNTK